MNDSRDPKSNGLTGAERAFIIAMVVWFLLQISRAIALVLIGEINAGEESKAWLYPAYLDLFAVALAPPLVFATFRRRGVVTWALTVVYWSISIVDHVGNFVTTTSIGPPSIAEDMSNPYLIPSIQTLVDAAFIALLFTPRYRELFFRIESSTDQAQVGDAVARG